MEYLLEKEEELEKDKIECQKRREWYMKDLEKMDRKWNELKLKTCAECLKMGKFYNKDWKEN